MEVAPPISDLRREFRRLADAGAELIMVPASVNAILEIRDMAPKLPEVTFVSLVGDRGFFDEVDVATAVFVEEQGGFLAGVAAATETRTGVVGFVGGAPVPDVHRRRAGFEAGVASVDPDITVLARYIGADGDIDRAMQRPDLGESAAADLFARNADVVFHAAGRSGLGIFKAAREATEATGQMHWGIGSDSDQILEVATVEQDHVLTSVVRKYDVVANDLVRALVDGDLERGHLRYSLADGALGYSTRGDHLSDEAVARIGQAEANIVAGTLTFPEIPNGDVLEPLDAPEPVATLEATYDGNNCSHRYEGPDVLRPGDPIRIVMVNNGTLHSTTIAFTDGYGIYVPANPGTSSTAYLVAPRGIVNVHCGHVEFPRLTTLVVG